MTARPDLSSIAEIHPLDCVAILRMLTDKGLDGVEVARILGVEKSTVRQWRRGHMPTEPSGRRLVALFTLYYPDEKIPSLA